MNDEEQVPQARTPATPADAGETPVEKLEALGVRRGILWQLARDGQLIDVDRIGNLTLITAPLNGSVSNGPWETKREGLREHAQLVLSSQVVDCEEWSEDAIEARGRTLARIACRVWARPTTEDIPAPAPLSGPA